MLLELIKRHGTALNRAGQDHNQRRLCAQGRRCSSICDAERGISFCLRPPLPQMAVSAQQIAACAATSSDLCAFDVYAVLLLAMRTLVCGRHARLVSVPTDSVFPVALA